MAFKYLEIISWSQMSYSSKDFSFLCDIPWHHSVLALTGNYDPFVHVLLKVWGQSNSDSRNGWNTLDLSRISQYLPVSIPLYCELIGLLLPRHRTKVLFFSFVSLKSCQKIDVFIHLFKKYLLSTY